MPVEKGKTPARKGVKKPKATMKSALKQLERALEESCPEVWGALRRGASEEGLAGLERAVGVKLPVELRELLQWRNGCKLGAFYGDYIFSSVQEIKAQYMTMKSARRGSAALRASYNALWIPFLNDQVGNFYCVDMAGVLGGKPGQIVLYDRERQTHPVVFAGLVKFVETLTALAEKGLLGEPEGKDAVAAEAARDAVYRRMNRGYPRRPGDEVPALQTLKESIEKLEVKEAWDKLSPLCDEALALAPDDAGLWSSKLAACFRLADHEGALAAADRLIALKPENENWPRWRMRALQGLKRYEEALAVGRTCIERASAGHLGNLSTSFIYRDVGRVCIEMGRHDAALIAYKTAASLAPDVPEYWVMLARARSACGKPKKARQAWEKARKAFEKKLALTPDDGEYLYGQAGALARLDDKEGALSHLKRAIAAERGRREQAVRDADFEGFREDAAFQALVRGGERVRNKPS